MQSFRYAVLYCSFVYSLLRLTTYRDYLHQCGPKLWSEKTQDSFIHLIESIVAANPTTVEKALIPEPQNVTAKSSEKKKEPKLNTRILLREWQFPSMIALQLEHYFVIDCLDNDIR
jgi:hypothetical protein